MADDTYDYSALDPNAGWGYEDPLGSVDLSSLADTGSVALSGLDPNAGWGYEDPLGALSFDYGSFDPNAGAGDDQAYLDALQMASQNPSLADPALFDQIQSDAAAGIDINSPDYYAAGSDPEYERARAAYYGQGDETLAPGADPSLYGKYEADALAGIDINSPKYNPKGVNNPLVGGGMSYGLDSKGNPVTKDASAGQQQTIKDAISKLTGGATAAQQPKQQQQDWMKMLMLMMLMSQLGKGSGSTGSSAVIPQLTASRAQLPYGPTVTPGRRPGSNAQTYFTPTQYAAAGGIMGDQLSLGAYASGGIGRLVKGPGDGVSDDVPATIDGEQPARIARGEYVIDARTVAALGNGSTDAGAERLDQMRDRILTADRKAKVGEDSKAHKHLL